MLTGHFLMHINDRRAVSHAFIPSRGPSTLCIGIGVSAQEMKLQMKLAWIEMHILNEGCLGTPFIRYYTQGIYYTCRPGGCHRKMRLPADPRVQRGPI